MSFLSYVLYTGYCPLLFSVVHLDLDLNLLLNVRLYIQVNFLPSVADEHIIVARGQDIGKEGGL